MRGPSRLYESIGGSSMRRRHLRGEGPKTLCGHTMTVQERRHVHKNTIHNITCKNCMKRWANVELTLE